MIITALGSLSPLIACANELNSKNNLAFFTDSHLDIQAKNLWRYLRDNNNSNTALHHIESAWGQGLAINFKSGYFADTVGINASYYGVLKLYANKHFNGRGIFERTTNNEAKGFNKIGQRYLKLKLGDETAGLKINYGWQALPRFGAITRSYTLSPNSYLGVTTMANWSGFSLKTGYVTSSMNRNSPHKIHFIGADRKKINGIFVTQLNYVNPLWSATYFYGQSENYLQRHAIEMSYQLEQNWKFNSKIYGTFAMKNYKNMPNTARINLEKPMDRRAFHYVIDGSYQTQHWNFLLGSAYTQAKKKKGLGRYPIHLATHSRGTFNALTAAGNDYLRDREVALFGQITRYITPTFSLSFNANYGIFKYEGHAIQSGDISFIGRWKPQHKSLKGLGVYVMLSPVNWSYANAFETPILNKNGRAQRKHSQSLEMYITYELLVF